MPTSLDRWLGCCLFLSTSSRVSGRCSDTATTAPAKTPRAPSPSVTKFHCAMPATGACTSSTALLSLGTGACALSSAPLETQASASSAAPLSQGTGAYTQAPLCRRREPAPRAPLLQADHGSLYFQRHSACDGNPRFERRSPQLRHYSGVGSLRLGSRSSRPRHGGPRTKRPPLSHAPHSSQTAAPARRSFWRECPTPPPPDHVVAVGLRCWKADIEAPRSKVKLDSAFPRNSGGRSTLFPIKEESTRLATSSPFPSRPTGRKPSPVGTLLSPTRANFVERVYWV